jgi:hypothetical protein
MNIKSALRAFPPDTVILSASEESWYMPFMRQMAVNTGRREGTAGTTGYVEGLYRRVKEALINSQNRISYVFLSNAAS